MKNIFLFIALAFCMFACEHTTQTTSGSSYVKKYRNIPTSKLTDEDEVDLQKQLLDIASVEPVLRFPARIGLARIDGGRLTSLPGEEAEAWQKIRGEVGDKFGEFIPLNPLVADMVSKNVRSKSKKYISVIDKIRLGAARQHLDAVLIYELYSKTDRKSNILSIADLTIIGGYLLPSRAIEAEGFANAMLIDVIQGYPYGTIDVTLDKEEVYATTWGARDRQRELSDSVKTKAAIKLTEEAKLMFENLYKELMSKDGK